jgi:hypothetical protein
LHDQELARERLDDEVADQKAEQEVAQESRTAGAIDTEAETKKQDADVESEEPAWKDTKNETETVAEVDHSSAAEPKHAPTTPIDDLAIPLGDATLIQEEAEARGVEPAQVVDPTLVESTNPIFSVLPPESELVPSKLPDSFALNNLMTTPSKVFLPSLSELPEGSPHIVKMLEQHVSARNSTTYLTDLPYEKDVNERPKMKVDPWTLVHSDAIPEHRRMCRSKHDWFKAYIKSCKDRLAGRDAGEHPEHFLIYSCTALSCHNTQGLSEHLTGVLYAFLLSIFTDRVLVVNWPESFPHVVYATFDYTGEASYSKFEEAFEAAEEREKLFFRFEDAGAQKMYVQLGGEEVPGVERRPLPAKEVDYGTTWSAAKYVLLEPPAPGLGLMKDLLLNPFLQSALRTTGFDSHTAWPCLMNLLLKPQRPLLKAMEPYLPFLLDPDVLVVGIQGRFNDRLTPDPSHLADALTPSALKRLENMSTDQRATYHAEKRRAEALGAPFDCAAELASAFDNGEVSDAFGMWKRSPHDDAKVHTAPPKDLRYFFMSNSKLLRNAVVEAYPDHALVLNITVAGEVGAAAPKLPSNFNHTALEQWQFWQRRELLSATWIEFWLFALCDHQVVPTVGQSGSFGKLAALRGFVQERYGERAILPHIWDGSRYFHPTCGNRAAGLTMDELGEDVDAAEAQEMEKQQRAALTAHQQAQQGGK